MSSSISSFEIQRFAVKYEPPTFVIEYKNKANGKIFVKKIRLRRIDGVNANQLTDKIISANLELLGMFFVFYRQ
jgi:transposase